MRGILPSLAVRKLRYRNNHRRQEPLGRAQMKARKPGSRGPMVWIKNPLPSGSLVIMERERRVEIRRGVEERHRSR